MAQARNRMALAQRRKGESKAALASASTRSALSERVAAEPLGPAPFKGNATAVGGFSVHPGQQH